MSYRYYDAICFIPQKNIKFIGFGILSSYYNKDCNFKIQWQVDDDASEELDVSFLNDDRDPETKTWSCMLE